MKARQGVERRQGAQEAVPTRAVAEEDAAAGDALEQAKVAGTGCARVDQPAARDPASHRASRHSVLPASILKSTLYIAFIL